MSIRIYGAFAILFTSIFVSCNGESPMSPATEELVGEASSPVDSSAVSSSQSLRQVKITICHVPPGNPDNAHEITVAEASLPAHFPHGDTLGTCEGEPPPTEECAGACPSLDDECCESRIECELFLDDSEEFVCQAVAE